MEPAPMRPRLGLLVFVVGAASLGAEIAAARLLAPYFGASTIIWANTIATVLVALSVGYAVGGRLADRWPHPRGLGAGGLGSLSVGGFLGSLVAVLGLVAVPVALLGCVAPFANRLAVDRLN